MDPDRPLKNQSGQALLELLLLAPLFLALLLALVFFVRAIQTRLVLIQTCRDTALALARDESGRKPDAVLQALLKRRGLESMGRWKLDLEAALPTGDAAASGPLSALFGAAVAERMTLSLTVPTPNWLPQREWQLQEQVTFKRGPWKAPYAKAIRSLMSQKK